MSRRSESPKDTSTGPDLYIERGGQVLDNAQRKPLLYDAKGKPLAREMGFRA